MAERKTCAPGEAHGDTGSASVRAQGASEPVKGIETVRGVGYRLADM